MSLSGGQKQRGGDCFGNRFENSILFFDEPTSGLDYQAYERGLQMYCSGSKGCPGITVYVVTHDLELILDCCTDIIHLEDGSIIDQYGMDDDRLRRK